MAQRRSPQQVESEARTAMLAMRDAGDLLAALDEYRRFERRLLREFAVEPSPALRRFATQMRSELAELKARAGALPLPTTTFVGRLSETAAALTALRERRHVALVGTAGVGKSRIAMRVARRLQRELDASVAYVSLEGVAPENFEAHLATAFAVDSSGAPQLLPAIVNALSERDTVVVLDGCESVADEAASFVTTLLDRTRSVRVITTSRRRFSARGETLTVAPLGVPAAGTLSLVGDETAIDFFVDRAAAVIPSFTLGPRTAPLVAEICRRLDGLPLALELAASRLNLMTLDELHRRIEDRFALLTLSGSAAEGSLREALQFSYDLLDDAQRNTLLRLAVFRDGWTLEAAEDVCSGQDVPAGRVLETLGALRDRSLIVTSEVNGAIRYGLLESLHAFAEDKLGKWPEERRLRARRHAEYYRAFVEKRAPAIARVESAVFAQIDVEYANLNAALLWAIEEDGLPRIGIETLSGLRRYVSSRGLARIVLPIARRLLEAVRPDQRETSWYGYGLRTAGTWATMCGQPDAHQFHTRAVEVFRSVGDERGIAHGLSSLASAAYRIGDYAQCEALFREALPMYERLGDRAALFLIRKNIGSLASALGRLDEAEEMFEAAMAVRDGAVTFDYENLVNNRANLAYLRGDYVRGIAYALEALEICRREGYRTLEALDLLAFNQYAAGECGAAWTTFREAFVQARTSEVPQSIAQVLEDSAVSGAQAGFDPEALVEALGFARALRVQHSNPVNPAFEPHLQKTEEHLRDLLGARTFEGALERGRAIGLGGVLDRLDALAAAAEEPDVIAGLTARESEIARLAVAGNRSSEIAEALFVSVRTVDNHLAAIYRKLGVKSRAQMVAAVGAEARRP